MDIEVSFPGGARVDARIGTHTVRTDQPREAGGEGSAPTPFETFLASIGTCAGIYVLGFCRRRGLSSEGVRLVERIETDPATHMVRAIRLDIHVPAGFPEEYRGALIRSAELCAVKKHLEDPPRFEIATVSDG